MSLCVCVFDVHLHIGSNDCVAVCRSQDKGFHLEKALLHVFSRSLPYTSVLTPKVEEVVEGEEVQYNIPAELSDYISRYTNTHSSDL